MTPKQAALLCNAYCIDSFLENDEEVQLLAVENPELLSAHRALSDFAIGAFSETNDKEENKNE